MDRQVLLPMSSGKMTFEKLVQETLNNLNEETLETTIKNLLEKNHQSEIGFQKDWNQRVSDEIDGFGPIEKLLQDPNISEICINAFDQIFIESRGHLGLSELKFVSHLTYDRFVKRLLNKMNKVADQRLPLADGMLDHYTRVHVALPPVSPSPRVTIRKHMAVSFSMEDLENLNMFSRSLRSEIETWLMEKKNILIVGPTSSGKTTLLRSCLKTFPITERLISLEDTGELGSVGPHHVNLLTRVDHDGLVPTIDLSLLLRNVLRMRPDRIIVGEVRGEEAVLLLDALATGHSGSMCTIHGSSGAGGLKRLESLVSRACPRWDLMAIRQLIFDSIDVVIFCDKKNGLRKISQTAVISGIESFGYLLDTQEY